MATGSRAGRPPESPEAKVLGGTWRPGREKAAAFEPEPGVPDPPSCLSKDAADEWRRVVPLLGAVLSKVDLAPLAMYCQSKGTWMKAQRVLNRKGLTMTTPQGYVQQRPEVAIAAKALKDWTDAARELGLTPRARRGVATTKQPEKQESKWDRFGKRS